MSVPKFSGLTPPPTKPVSKGPISIELHGNGGHGKCAGKNNREDACQQCMASVVHGSPWREELEHS